MRQPGWNVATSYSIRHDNRFLRSEYQDALRKPFRAITLNRAFQHLVIRTLLPQVKMRAGALLSVVFVGTAMAHGDHGGSQKPVVPDDANWMTKHMAGLSRRYPLATAVLTSF